MLGERTPTGGVTIDREPLVDNYPLPSVGMWCTFAYADAPGAITFLRDVFGFTVSVRYHNRDDPALVDHAELRWPLGGGVMLGTAKADKADLGLGGSAYVVCRDIDGLHRRCVDAGASIVRALYETDYGSREFSVSDLEGNVWSFGTYPGHDEEAHG